MKDYPLRALMRAKRDFISFIGYRPNNHVSVYGGEKPKLDNGENLGVYSRNSYSEFLDPRIGQTQGHFFNQRDIFLVNKVIIEPRQGSLYSSSGSLISESTNWSNSKYYESFPWNAGSYSNKTSLSQVIVLSSNSFGHWLIEDLPSTIFLLKKFPNSPLVVARKHPKYVADFLMTIDHEIVLADGPVFVESAIFVSKRFDSGWINPQDILELRSFAAAKTQGMISNHAERIYASRVNLSRSPCNEKLLEKEFQQFGFEILQLEELNFIDEIHLMSRAKIIAGISGSWIFNSVWMKQSGKVLDIVNENYWGELNHRVCIMCGIDYFPLLTSGDYSAPVNISKVHQLLTDLEL